MKLDIERIKRDRLFDLFFSSTNLIGYGITSFLLVVGWAIGSPLMFVAGIIGSAFIGSLAVQRWQYHGDELTDNAIGKAYKRHEDELYHKIDGTEIAIFHRHEKSKEAIIAKNIADMVSVYKSFSKDISDGKLKVQSSVRDRILTVMESCVTLIGEYIVACNSVSSVVNEENKQKIQKRVDKIGNILSESATKLVAAIDDTRTLAITGNTRNVEEQCGELEELLDYSKEVDAQMESMSDDRFDFLREHVGEGSK